VAIDFDSWKENLAEQQAQFWADLRALEARQAETARLFDENRRLSEENRQNIARLVDVCMSLANHGEETDRRLRETDQFIRELRDVQAETGQRLNALIDVVDKLVRRNGKG
jgi:ABC-type transporter Mla subunit MlaD